MNNSENNFLDKNTILAILLVGIGWYAWQSYLNKKYPNMNNQKTEITEQKEVHTDVEMVNKIGSKVENQVKEKTVFLKPTEYKEETTNVLNEFLQFDLSNYGFSLKNYELKKYTKRDKTPIQFSKNNDGSSDRLFEISLIGSNSPLIFKIEKETDNQFIGTSQIGKTTIQDKIEYNPESYSFKHKISVLNPDENFKGIQVSISEKIENYSAGSFLIPSYEHQEFIILHSEKKEERLNISSLKETLNKTYQNVSTISISNQYFSAAVTDKSEIIPEVQLTADPNLKTSKMFLVYKQTNLKEKLEYNFITYAGPKTQSTFEKADISFVSLLNFGFFGSIGKILLTVLKWFNNFVNNWGFSIILLTILVRFLVLPFNIASYKSMKKMQKIQPMIQSIKTRYKDDPAALNRETMLLMKENKVNPLGGCLPMLLQMPILFALFQVLGNSIEIYQAPFIFWIHDLSVKDPFYVLPILMGITLFIQHKITPTTMDPAQAKVMQFMPIIFSLMMVSLPSGLTLYTFVSTLFGILQQRFFTSDSNKTVLNKEVKA